MIPAIEIENLTFGYTKKNPVLSEVSFTVGQSKICALLGLNGSGKSTLIKCIMKFLNADMGQITINGLASSTLQTDEFSKQISYVPQEVDSSCDYLVRDYLLLGRMPYHRLLSLPEDDDWQVVNHYIAEFQLEAVAQTPLSELSGGQRQLISIVRALVQETPIVIMDEPMSALDLTKQGVLLKTIKRIAEQGKTIVFSTHNPNHAFAVGAEVCLLQSGRLCAYGCAEDVLTPSAISQIYGDAIHLKGCGPEAYCTFEL